MDRLKDYYAALGVSRGEGIRGIHDAYRRLAKQCHPDRVGDKGTEQFQEIQEAYEVLSDPTRKKPYDATLERQEPLRRARPEPLVPASPPSWQSQPEPLVSSRVVPEDFGVDYSLPLYVLRWFRIRSVCSSGET